MTCRCRVASVVSLFAVGCLLALAGFALPANQSLLAVPPFDNLSVREGYFNGADGVRLFYRLVGKSRDVVVFLHGGPGLGIDDGGYDLEPLAARVIHC